MSYGLVQGLSLLLFVIGLAGVMSKKNLLTQFMSAEIMLLAVNINLVAISAYKNFVDAQILVIFIMAVAAVEAGIGLALFIQLYRRSSIIDTDKLNNLKG